LASAVDALTPIVATLPGDGIGPEIMAPTVRILSELGNFEFRELLIGGAAIDAQGVSIADETVETCRSADAVLFGAAGGPKWDTTDPARPRAESGLLRLRQELGLYGNLRPVRPHPALFDASPLREERLRGTNLLIVRELTGGLYFGERGRRGLAAFDTCVYSAAEIERVVRLAFRLASSKVTSVDKSNVLETSRLWREIVEQVEPEFPAIELEQMLVDNAAMQLLARPADFEVLVTENMFGDILSEQAAMLTGSIGLLPSASLGERGSPGLFEPIHGSAPDIAGTGVANPLGMFLAAAMMLRLGLGMNAQADALEEAVWTAVDDGLRTPDLGGSATTEKATQTVLNNL
jgi:3-isopropylmalate dehydrogenase